MQLSKLIEMLIKLKEEHGDMPCRLDELDPGIEPIASVPDSEGEILECVFLTPLTFSWPGEWLV